MTPNFSLKELTSSTTAQRLGIENIPDATAVANLEALAKNVLQPVRDILKRPVVISSGYRCAKLNKAVGGSATSQHLTGEAADIKCNSVKDAFEVIGAIMKNGIYDQLILEIKGSTVWIHVSSKLNTKLNRSQIKIIKV